MYLISYDMSNNRLRSKVAKELENFGKRVQFSVFECDISKERLDILYKRLVNIMLSEPEGNIRIYTICADCRNKIQIIGNTDRIALLTEEEEELFVI